MTEIIKRNGRTAWRTYDAVTIVITPDDRMVHKLNETATFVWGALGEEGKDPGELVTLLTGEFDAPAEAMESDLRELIGEMERKGLVTRENG